MSDKLRIKCFSCGKVLTVPASSVGKTGKCPQCKTSITIERPERRPKKRPTPADPKPKPQQRTRPPIDVVQPQLDSQPTHRDEINNDRYRVLAAVSNSPDKFALIEPYLMDYEQPVAMAVQRKFPFSAFADIVLLSSHRLMVFKRFFTKITMFDVNYVDFGDVTIQQGFFTSSIIVSTDDHRSCSVSRLVTDQALSLYRQCQNIETKARLARRQFQLEENRSHTTQMHINNVQPPAVPGLDQPNSGQAHLGHSDISGVGDEENDPYRLGE
jgi:phage FluMu protein Com